MKKNIKTFIKLIVIFFLSLLLLTLLTDFYKINNKSFVKHIDISSLSQEEQAALKRCREYNYLYLLKKIEPINPEEGKYKFIIQISNGYTSHPIIGKVPNFRVVECISPTVQEMEEQKIIESKLYPTLWIDFLRSPNKNEEMAVLILAKESRLRIESKLLSVGKWSKLKDKFALTATLKLSDLRELALDDNVLYIEPSFDNYPALFE